MRHLEQVDARQALRQHRWVDVLLHIAGQEEPTLPDDAEQDDRHVIDAAAGIGRLGRDPAADRPEHAHRDLVDRQPITRGDGEADRRTGTSQPIEPGRVPRSRATHPGFEDPVDAIAVEEQRQAGDVVLVRVRQDHRVEPPVPRRDPPIELDQQSIGIGAAIDQKATTARPLDQDGVALADVEDRDPRRAGRARDDDGARDRDGHDEAHRGDSGRD
jgi:hypothetical protein